MPVVSSAGRRPSRTITLAADAPKGDTLHYRPTKFRTVLLLTVAFIAGAIIGPASDLIAQRFLFAFGIGAALAQGTDKTETYRLLALFGDVFELVRGQYVDPVPDKKLIENAVNGMLAGLDPHSAYLNAAEFSELEAEDKGQFSGIGIEIEQEGGVVRVIRPMDNSPAVRAGIKAGDTIIGLNGKSVLGLSADRMIDQMRGPSNTRITLTIQRTGLDHPLVISMRRKVIRVQVVKQRLEPDNIGYVRVNEFTERADAALKHAIRSLKGQAGGKLKALVLDLRDNPGGLLDQAVAVARDFIPGGAIVSTRARYSDDSEWVAGKGTDILGGAPMVVLINSGSASASEVVAGALQDHHRAVLVGSRSFGKGSVQATIPLAGGGGMLLTVARYYTPSGRSIQGRGIVPDVLVAERDDEVPQFDPEHEANLNHVISNAGGTPDNDDPPRTDLPPIAKTIPSRPSKGFPEFDAAKPETDFQLQQALLLVRAMATAEKPAPAN
jgi:carboxyl-terminal processing protease